MAKDETPEEMAERKARALQDMEAAGVSTEESAQVDYFGFDETYRVELPDGKSFVEHQALNEGARRKYMNEVNREVRLQKGGDAFMSMATGDERHSLLESAICGWNLMRGGKAVAFNKQELRAFLSAAPPRIIDLIEKDIREKNDWLTGDVTEEDIDEQIADLEELREKIKGDAEGKDS